MIPKIKIVLATINIISLGILVYTRGLNSIMIWFLSVCFWMAFDALEMLTTE